MGKRFYRFLRGVARKFIAPKMTTEWEVPFDGEPCIFVCNHAGAYGPIDMMARFDLCDEVIPWMNDSVRHVSQVPAYVRQDYWWEPGCKMEWLYNITLPYLVAPLLPLVLNSVEGVSVFHDNRVVKTMREGLRYLKEGKHQIIFPEQPKDFNTSHDWINTGWLLLGPMYYKATGKNLKMWPVHIDHDNHCFQVAAPVEFDGTRPLKEQEDEIAARLVAGFRQVPYHLLDKND